MASTIMGVTNHEGEQHGHTEPLYDCELSDQEKVLALIKIRRDPWSRDVPIVLISEHLKEIPDLFLRKLSDYSRPW